MFNSFGENSYVRDFMGVLDEIILQMAINLRGS
jgi:hypothetical protein